jgi:phosphatidate cytidylyltransferase
MLARRFATAAVGVPLMLICGWFGGLPLLGLVLALTLVGLREFQHVAAHAGLASNPWPSFALAAALPVAAHIEAWAQVPALVTLFVLATLAAQALSGRKDRALPNVAATLLGPLYVALLFSHLVLLRQLPAGRSLLILVFVVVWFTDMGAYFVGRYLGRRQLAPILSPNKTVEGAWGGIAIGVGSAAVAAGPLAIPAGTALIGALLASVASQAGDLWESALKRSAGVKDSGGVLPGHGGILDRFDSLLFAAAVAYYYFSWTAPPP